MFPTMAKNMKNKSDEPKAKTRPPAKGIVRTLQSCLAEVRRCSPSLTRSERRACAKLLLQASELEVFRHKLGDKAFDALFRDFIASRMKGTKGARERK